MKTWRIAGVVVFAVVAFCGLLVAVLNHSDQPVLKIYGVVLSVISLIASILIHNSDAEGGAK